MSVFQSSPFPSDHLTDEEALVTLKKYLNEEGFIVSSTSTYSPEATEESHDNNLPNTYFEILF